MLTWLRVSLSNWMSRADLEMSGTKALSTACIACCRWTGCKNYASRLLPCSQLTLTSLLTAVCSSLVWSSATLPASSLSRRCCRDLHPAGLSGSALPLTVQEQAMSPPEGSCASGTSLQQALGGLQLAEHAV